MCGNKLDDDARFCPVCGTPVAQAEKTGTPQRPPQGARRTVFPLAVIVLIAILVIAVIGVAIAFVPFQPVSFNQSNEAVSGNMDALRIVVDADVANVNVM